MSEEENKHIWNFIKDQIPKAKLLQTSLWVRDLPKGGWFPESIKEQMKLLAYRMLALPDRFYVMREIKEPLLTAIIVAGRKFNKRFGNVTKENTVFRNTHAILDIWDTFLGYYWFPARRRMFRELRNISAAEIEHDPHYRFVFDFLGEEYIKAVLDGKIEPRPEGHSRSKDWHEPQPHGGKYSIIAAIQAKSKEIKEILATYDPESAEEPIDTDTPRRQAQARARVAAALYHRDKLNITKEGVEYKEEIQKDELKT